MKTEKCMFLIPLIQLFLQLNFNFNITVNDVVDLHFFTDELIQG